MSISCQWYPYITLCIFFSALKTTLKKFKFSSFSFINFELTSDKNEQVFLEIVEHEDEALFRIQAFQIQTEDPRNVLLRKHSTKKYSEKETQKFF